MIAPDPARLQALEALSAALGDPHRLVDELLAAQDDADARVRVSAGFGLTDAQAQVVLDNRFGLLSRTRRAELAEDLQAERTPLGPELHLQAVWDPTGRTVTVSEREVPPCCGSEVGARRGPDIEAAPGLDAPLHDCGRRQPPALVAVSDADRALERTKPHGPPRPRHLCGAGCTHSGVTRHGSILTG